MKVEIVAIGDEVLAGLTVNSNAAFISKSLFEEGFSIYRHTSMPDRKDALFDGLKEAMQRSELVICSGGLGPTFDDNTREVVAKLFNSDFYFDENVANDLLKRFGDSLKSLKDQATVPSKAKVLLNPVGTAPGLIFSSSKNTLVLLPGVPEEMKVIFRGGLLPYLRENFPRPKKYLKTINLVSAVEVDVDRFLKKLDFPNVKFGIYPVLLESVAVKMQSEDKKLLEKVSKTIEREFKNVFYEDTIEEAVLNVLVKNGKTLSVAESCTGGSLAARLVSVPGASDSFIGGVVAYSNDVKRDVLGVKSLDAKGAVSKEVVEEMAVGVKNKLKTDYSIAISGVAGPSGGTKEKPVGTVWCAIAYPDGVQAYNFRAHGHRESIIKYIVSFALSKFWDFL